MANVSQEEWLNQNALRNYPIREDAQRRVSSPRGGFLDGMFLPNYLITDFVMSVGSEASTDIYIMKVAVIGDALTLVFGSGDSVAASVYIDLSSHVVNKYYAITGTGSFENAKGCVVVGDVDRFREEFPDGVYNFSENETAIEPRCVRPSIVGVSSICVFNENTGYESKKLRGDVKLIAGKNISLKYDGDRNAIWISADNNSGYNEICECGGSDTTVKTLNGLSVENITLVGDDCVEVSTEGQTIKIKDKCSKPCCGCAEIDFINEKISIMNTAINKIDNYTEVMATRITELQASYVQAFTGSTNKQG